VNVTEVKLMIFFDEKILYVGLLPGCPPTVNEVTWHPTVKVRAVY
jgi:hypothetical protein